MGYREAIGVLAQRMDLCSWMKRQGEPAVMELRGCAEAEALFAEAVLSRMMGTQPRDVRADVAAEFERMAESGAAISKVQPRI